MKKIAILGSGTVGQTFATRLNALGYEVMIGTRNLQEKLAAPGKDGAKNGFAQWHEKNGTIKAGTFEEAAAFGEMILNVSQGANSIAVLNLAKAKNLEGKILVDISNPLDFSKGMPPGLVPELSNFNSLGEEIQKTFSNAKVVKTLNTMWCGIMVDPSIIKGDHINYICGNDEAAKTTVKEFLNTLGWKDQNILDLGDLSSARGTEAVLPVWLRIYGAKKMGAFNFNIVS
ncbi:MAG: NAD(P)-binding domain-containing protein [Bacteroidetes bacterium]|nr:NAD(P)-binding domain-containing protein [Bacteroidota bacterium]